MTSRVVRRWVWGDKRMGYSIRVSGGRNITETWLKNVRVRTDEFRTDREAESYARYRKRSYYGNKTPAQARRAYL